MNLKIKEYNKSYEMNIGNITQILGSNFKIKNFIYNSLCRHFSLYKYQDYDEYMEDNILIDQVVPGRKEYKLIDIQNREKLIELIKLTKNSLVWEYIQKMLETLVCQKQLNLIDENLTNIYFMINEKLKENKCDISLDYDLQNLFSIVSKSEIYTTAGDEIETLDNYSLLKIFLNLLKENNKFSNEKVLVLISNIDHLCTKKEYNDICRYLQNYDRRIYTLFFISTDDYVHIDEAIMNNIIVINDCFFQVPEYDILEEYLLNNYPINQEFSKIEMMNILKRVLNKLGIERDFHSYQDLLVKKLINKAICVNDYYDFNMKNSEFVCLNSN